MRPVLPGLLVLSWTVCGVRICMTIVATVYGLLLSLFLLMSFIFFVVSSRCASSSGKGDQPVIKAQGALRVNILFGICHVLTVALL